MIKIFWAWLKYWKKVPELFFSLFTGNFLYLLTAAFFRWSEISSSSSFFFKHWTETKREKKPTNFNCCVNKYKFVFLLQILSIQKISWHFSFHYQKRESEKKINKTDHSTRKYSRNTYIFLLLGYLYPAVYFFLSSSSNNIYSNVQYLLFCLTILTLFEMIKSK